MKTAMYDSFGKRISGDDIFSGDLPENLIETEMPRTENGKTFLRASDGSINVIELENSEKSIFNETVSSVCRTKEDAIKKLLFEDSGQYAKEICKKHGIPFSENRCVLKIETREDISAYTGILSSSFESDGIYILPLSEHRLAVICPSDDADIDETAAALSATLTDMNTDNYIGIGSVCENAAELVHSFNQASAAIETGKKLSYTGGVWRFADILPEVIVSEIPKEKREDIKARALRVLGGIDSDTTELAHAFFKNNLNISETARCCYLHRNTLIYRLDKIFRETGFDLRNFDEAVAFRLLTAINRISRQG